MQCKVFCEFYILRYLYFVQDLENCMRKHPESRLQHIQEIGNSLIGEKIMSDKMKSDLDSVTNRWNKLSQQVCFVVKKLITRY